MLGLVAVVGVLVHPYLLREACGPFSTFDGGGGVPLMTFRCRGSGETGEIGATALLVLPVGFLSVAVWSLLGAVAIVSAVLLARRTRAARVVAVLVGVIGLSSAGMVAFFVHGYGDVCADLDTSIESASTEYAPASLIGGYGFGSSGACAVYGELPADYVSEADVNTLVDARFPGYALRLATGGSVMIVAVSVALAFMVARHPIGSGPRTDSV
ncbi:hypothetical protein [Allonocardiopsis opalescens]|uniref:hypothetical protein n=1 Tax=Allonocardiopsis opalescens TaxID=1144618 RepID=UPI0011B264BD|nr:hypothetical protein [Allonocardiopsis opalescens]